MSLKDSAIEAFEELNVDSTHATTNKLLALESSEDVAMHAPGL